MLPLTEGGVERNIEAWVYQWFKRLAAGRLDEACAQLDEPSFYGRAWTPELILHTLHDTFSPDTIFYTVHPEGPIFTDPDELEPCPYKGEVIAFEDGSGYAYDHDIPLNAEWSVLTALFEFRKRPGGLACILEDLHVM